MAVDTAAALRKLTSGQTLTAAEKEALGMGTTSAPTSIKTMTQEQIDAATAKTISAGGKSTDAANRLPGETASQANARISAGYKEMLAKPILPEGAAEAGAKVQFVRVGSGGQGEYAIVTPIGYNGPQIISREWTDGIIPATGKYTTGSSAGATVVGGKVVSGGTTPPGTPPGTPPSAPPKTPPGSTPPPGTPERPVGTPPAFVYNSSTGKWEMPPKPTSAGNWVWDNTKGWTNTTLVPGSSGFTSEGGPTLALNTFKNTLALFFGAGEMSQAWVDALYKVVAGYVNTGSTIDESLNLSLQDVRNNPALVTFTKRFQGLYALQDRLVQGEAIEVPTIAEFFKSESAMGDVLRSVGLGDLATQDFLGDVLGRGKSVLEVTNLINNTFKAIDNAPAALKADLQTYFPGVDRTSLAKALLTGKEGWQELDRKIRGVSVLSAAKSQGVDVSLASATDIADLGFDYSGALSGFETVKRLERGKMLGEISGTKFGQEEAVGATFYQNVKAKQDIEQLAGLERARFAGSSGRLASRSRAQGLI
jgi:hypothetical protein